jgi:endonuclease YncB( thermonuclease family)
MGPSLAAVILSMACAGAAVAAPCRFAAQGEGRVEAVVDARSLRLDDGREIRLAGVTLPLEKLSDTAALSTATLGRAVTLEGADDAPDRYGRQPAFVVAEGDDTPLQIALLRRGLAIHDGTVADAACAEALRKAEAEGRRAAAGVWAAPAAIKNAERPDDILAVVGQFAVIEGKALSVRQSGATFYVNFGRRWTDGFAVTISRRMIAALEAAGLAPKGLEGRRLRIRGVVERRGGPRIEIVRTGQIEFAE